MFYSIIYQSIAKDKFTSKDIDLMLTKAKLKNNKIGVTGCIIFCGGQFIQIIEGKKNVIEELYDVIKVDERHYNVNTLIATASKNTLWEEWSMAFYNFSGNFEQNKHSRILLETYFDSADKNQKSSEVFLVLKKNILELINGKETR